MSDSETDTPGRVRIGGAGLARYFTDLATLDRNARLFLTVTAFRGIVIAALAVIVNLYLASLGYDAGFIGIITGVNSLAVLLVSVPFGYLADRFGRRRVLVAGAIAYPLSILGLGLSSTTPAILIFMFLFGIFAVPYWVAGVPLLFASTTPAQRVQAFSINSFLLWGLGPLGALLSGATVEIAARALGISAASTTALRFGMMFMVAVAVVGSIPYFFLREPEAEPAPRDDKPSGRGVASLFMRLLLPDLVLAFGLGGVLTFMQLYFHDRFGLNAGPVGLIMAIGGLIGGVGTLFTPLVARRWGNLRSTVRFQWATVPLITGVAFATNLAVAIPLYWALLTVRNMADPVYTAFVQERVPEVYRARLTGMYSVTYSIGYSFGPAVSGQLQKIGGFTPAFLLGALCYLLGAMLLFVFFGRESFRERDAENRGVA